MRIVKRLGMVLVAACAFSALAVSSASAIPLFLAHTSKTLLLASAGSSIQKFVTQAGVVECTALKLVAPGDTTPALKSSTLLAIVKYEKCTAFGISATVDPVHFLFFANGLVRLLANATILAASGCVVTVPAASNQSLWTVKYENTQANGGILLLAAVRNITSSGVGGPGEPRLCEYATESAGTYNGNTHIVADGGIILWESNA
jgi:hypothetical protein